MRFSFAVILTALAACATVSATDACTAKSSRCYPKHDTCCSGLKCTAAYRWAGSQSM
ncbi:hypothetical protein P692DRAFT_20838372, partial [Suillus brevipes Sb2]